MGSYTGCCGEGKARETEIWVGRLDQLRSVFIEIGGEARALEQVAAVKTLRLGAVNARLVFPGARYSAEAVVSKLSGGLS